MTYTYKNIKISKNAHFQLSTFDFMYTATVPYLHFSNYPLLTPYTMLFISTNAYVHVSTFQKCITALSRLTMFYLLHIRRGIYGAKGVIKGSINIISYYSVNKYSHDFSEIKYQVRFSSITA